MQSLPGLTMETCTLGCVIDATGVFFVRRVANAAVLMKAVCSNCTGLVQSGSFKIQVEVASQEAKFKLAIFYLLHSTYLGGCQNLVKQFRPDLDRNKPGLNPI